MRMQSIYNTHPDVVSIDETKGSFDAHGKRVSLDEIKVSAELTRLQARSLIDEFNKPIYAQLKALDAKRIRPLAEGDTAYLAKLNKQIAALRATLK